MGIVKEPVRYKLEVEGKITKPVISIWELSVEQGASHFRSKIWGAETDMHVKLCEGLHVKLNI